MMVYKPKDFNSNAVNTKCWDYDTVTNTDFEFNFTYEQGSLACDGDSVYRCTASTEECNAIKPGNYVETPGIPKVWSLTRGTASKNTEEEMKS